MDGWTHVVPEHGVSATVSSELFERDTTRVGVAFRYDPLAHFLRQSTPHALYVRRVVLQQNTAARRTAERRLRATFLLEQRENGSWGNSVIKTIDRLFLLYLLGDEGSDEAQKGTRWLLEDGQEPMRHTCGDGVSYDHLFFRLSRSESRALVAHRGLVTTPGCAGFIKTGAALYFASVFGLAEEERVERAMQTLVKVAQQRGLWCSVSCSINILRAFLAHPRYAGAAVAREAVEILEREQTRTGSWRGAQLFYHTFNTLAHSTSRSAVRQVSNCLERLQRTQNSSGTWGRRHADLASLLVVDGLRRHGLL